MPSRVSLIYGMHIDLYLASIDLFCTALRLAFSYASSWCSIAFQCLQILFCQLEPAYDARHLRVRPPPELSSWCLYYVAQFKFLPPLSSGCLPKEEEQLHSHVFGRGVEAWRLRFSQLGRHPSRAYRYSLLTPFVFLFFTSLPSTHSTFPSTFHPPFEVRLFFLLVLSSWIPSEYPLPFSGAWETCLEGVSLVGWESCCWDF